MLKAKYEKIKEYGESINEEVRNKNKFRPYSDSSGCIFKLTLITQTNLKKGRGVLLPGALNKSIIIGAEIKFYNFLKFHPKCV